MHKQLANGSVTLLRLDRVSKRFGGIQAVRDATVDILAGEVHALVGENGAGKSTLGKIIGGAIRPDSGKVVLGGSPVAFSAPHDALRAGIAVVHQESALVPHLGVPENVFLGIEAGRAGMVRRDLADRLARLEADTGMTVPRASTVHKLSVAARKEVEILRALARDARLIVMDEPTASLSASEADRLLTVIRQLADAGTAVVFVSHHLDEVIAVANRVTVMRNGEIVRTAAAAAETHESLVTAMLGRDAAALQTEKRPVGDDAPAALTVVGLQGGQVFQDITFSVRRGEIVGVAGLVGSGRSEVARAIFGADRLLSGSIHVSGRPYSAKSPHDAVEAGLAMIPESRKEQGLLLGRSIRENITLPRLSHFATGGLVRRTDETDRVRELIQELDIRPPDPEARAGALSGGNQQKVLFAKWLVRRPTVLIADEPTAGVDVGAKAAIHGILRDLASEGVAVLLISSELEEILALSHRVLVMRAGRMVRELHSDTISEEAIMEAALGVPTADQSWLN